MGLSGYLDTSDDDLQPVDAADEEEQQRLRLLAAGPPGDKPAWWKPPTDIPAPRPIEDAVAPESPEPPPDLPSVATAPVPSAPPGRMPVDQNVQDALARRNAVFGNKPVPKDPKWWQRALAGAAGFGAGYYNAEGKAKHIDPTAAEDVALGGPGNRKREAAWQHDVQTAELGLQGAQGEREAWFKKNQEEAKQRLEQSQEGRLEAQAKREAGRNDIDLQKIKQADAEKQDALALKGRDDAYLLEPGQSAPPGWDAIPSKANPGRTYAAPQRFAALPPDLVPYAPGRKAGELVPMNEIKAARATAQKDTLAQNKPTAIKEPTNEYEGILREFTDPKTGVVDYKKANAVADQRGIAKALASRPPAAPRVAPDKTAALKEYQPSIDSAERFNIMAKNYEDGLRGNQQAMVSLLMNHIGMTLGAQKGARMTKDVIHEAENTLPWLQKVKKQFSSDGILSGITLSPQQMKQMVDLGAERFREDTAKARNSTQFLGIEGDGPKRIPSRATFNRYKALANGDLVKATQLAKEDGWSVE